MKAKLRDKWVAALESGEYEQHQDSLSNGKGFCCLGVLATIAKKKIRKNSDLKVVKTKFALTIESADRSGEVSDSHSLPLGALKAVGLDEDLAEQLASINDDSVNFKKVIKKIKKMEVTL